MALSADGYLARGDGSVDWLDRPRPRGNYGWTGFWDSIDTVVVGRETFEFARHHGMEEFGGKTTYVFTHRPLEAEHAIRVDEPDVRELAGRLRRNAEKDIWLCGGASVIGAFLDADEVDDLILNVVPVLIGEGIPLATPARRTLRLELRSTKRFRDGVVRLHYSPASNRAGANAPGDAAQ